MVTVVLSHHSRWEPLEGEGGPGELPRQWAGVSVCLSQSVGLASLACVKSWVSCPAPQRKKQKKNYQDTVEASSIDPLACGS